MGVECILSDRGAEMLPGRVVSLARQARDEAVGDLQIELALKKCENCGAADIRMQKCSR